MENKKILITGGTGFIGSHLTASLLLLGHDVIVLDNLSNSNKSIIDKISIISNKSPIFYEGDIQNYTLMEKIFQDNNIIDCVIHLAGLKSIGESTKKISSYHKNNISGSITLFEVMEKYGCKSIIFSSTATVYSEHSISPLDEDSLLRPTNPYSNSKLIIESILNDYSSYAGWKVISLRYFNPIGAHPSGFLGEEIDGNPNNLLPIIMKNIVEGILVIPIFGMDYDTPDGTCVRDYIHIMDLVSAHINALDYLDKGSRGVSEVFNIGTGFGVSVLDIINIVSSITGNRLEFQIMPRRSGDSPITYCNPSKANYKLGWKPRFTHIDAVEAYWKFIKKSNWID